MPIKDQSFDVFAVLPVRIINPINQVSVDTYGILDSGSDGCVIPGYIAQKLGFLFKKDYKKEVDTAGGKTNAFSFKTKIEIYHPVNPPSNLIYTIDGGPTNCIVNLKFVLLGVNCFLSNFVLKIDYPNHLFSLTR